MVVPTVSNWFEAIVVSIAGALMTFLAFIPALIGAIIVLIVGWIVSGFVGRIVTTLLERVGFETAAQRTGVSDFMSRSGVRDARASRVIGELAKWFIRLIFIEAAAQAVHLQAVVQVVNSIVLWIPNLIVALIVLLIGFMLAKFVAGIVRGATSEAGFQNPNLMASIAQVAIMAFAVIVAVNQVGIAAQLVNALFMAFVGALALALGLSFGLGGRDVAGRMWQQWYQRGQAAAPKLEQAAARASEQAQQQAGEAAGQPQATGSDVRPLPRGARYRVTPE